MLHLPCPSTSVLDEFPVEVVFNERGKTGLYHMRLKFSPGRFHRQPHQVKPGEFLMLDIQDDRDFRFRRPFSLMSWHPETQEGDLIYKVVGEGTQRMAQWQAGTKSLVLSSLGVGFDDYKIASPKRTLLLAGGVGLAPLILWAEAGRAKGWSDDEMPTLIFGVGAQEEMKPLLPHLSKIVPLDKLMLCTDDGSYGWHGHVVNWMQHHVEQVKYNFDTILICGPNPMMAASVREGYRLLPEAKMLVSLENHMPCGTGACYGCAVGQSEGRPPIKICEVGPVLEAAQLAWSETGPESQSFTYQEGVFPTFSAETVAGLNGGLDAR